MIIHVALRLQAVLLKRYNAVHGLGHFNKSIQGFKGLASLKSKRGSSSKSRYLLGMIRELGPAPIVCHSSWCSVLSSACMF